MALSKTFKKNRRALLSGNEEVATLRGITSEDLSLLLTVIGGNIDGLFSAAEEFDRGSLALGDTDALSEQLMDRAPAIFAGIARNMPDVIHTIIAVSAIEDGDGVTIADAVDMIRQWPIPLQAEALKLVFVETFNSPEGFRLFVGNVKALVGSVRALTSVGPSTPAPVQSSGAG